MNNVVDFSDIQSDPPVHGYLHRPISPAQDVLVLTHGAGGNARMPLLLALANAFADAGAAVLRCDLPFRQERSFGPPRPGDAARDRAGLQNAVRAMKKTFSGRVFLGGQSYGGRQASMLCAENRVAEGLLLLSYPLHPPGRPEQLRTQHLPQIGAPVMFVHGTRDPFGTVEEIDRARKLIPGLTALLPVEGAGHDLGFKVKSRCQDLPHAVVTAFQAFFNKV
jgi:predicted alpha/beta-hydrolase family hydrolase